MLRAFKQIHRSPDLNDLPFLHDHDLIGKGQCLRLVVGDVDHCRAHALVQLLQLRTQLPFQMRVYDGQRFVEHDGVDILAHQTASEGYLLLAVGGQSRGAVGQRVRQIEHFGNGADTFIDSRFVNTAIAQGKGEIVVDGHGVVDDGELEYLGDMALVGLQISDILAIEQNAALGRPDQAGNDVQETGLATAGRPEKGIGTAIVPVDIDLLQGPVRLSPRIGHIGMTKIIESDFRHRSRACKRVCCRRRNTCRVPHRQRAMRCCRLRTDGCRQSVKPTNCRACRNG